MLKNREDLDLGEEGVGKRKVRAPRWFIGLGIFGTAVLGPLFVVLLLLQPPLGQVAFAGFAACFLLFCLAAAGVLAWSRPGEGKDS